MQTTPFFCSFALPQLNKTSKNRVIKLRHGCRIARKNKIVFLNENSYRFMESFKHININVVVWGEKERF
jgi:hypothetical protein